MSAYSEELYSEMRRTEMIDKIIAEELEREKQNKPQEEPKVISLLRKITGKVF